MGRGLSKLQKVALLIALENRITRVENTVTVKGKTIIARDPDVTNAEILQAYWEWETIDGPIRDDENKRTLQCQNFSASVIGEGKYNSGWAALLRMKRRLVERKLAVLTKRGMNLTETGFKAAQKIRNGKDKNVEKILDNASCLQKQNRSRYALVDPEEILAELERMRGVSEGTNDEVAIGSERTAHKR